MTDLHFETAGSGPRVLLVQGVGVAGCGWAPQVEGLKDAFELAWFDNRGVGASPGVPGTMEDMARAALEVMDALGWESASLVGHSLGGVIAQQVRVLAPERVERLGMLCTFAKGRSALSLEISDLWANLRTMVGTYGMRRRAFYELVSDPTRPPTDENLAELESAFGRDLTALPGAATAQLRALLATDLREALSAMEPVPSLVVSAKRDRLAPVSQGPLLSAALRATYVEVPGGHAVPVQDAPRINALLRELLAP
ncbi:MAG: alpha/beta hydrolase [Myxococcota bacterium]